MPTLAQHETPISAEAIDVLLQHLARYRLTVSAAVAKLPQFNDCSPQSVKQLLRACRQRSLLNSAPLHSRQRYWHMTELGAERCGLPTDRIGPLSETAKIRAYALLHFCCLSDKPRHRLTAADMARNFPDLHRPGLPTGYYFDPAGNGRIGLARVDAGHHGRWDRVIETLRADIAHHIRQSNFRRLVHAGHFEIALLTVFPEKANRIEATLAKHRDANRISVRVFSIPQLLPVVLSTR